MTTKTHEEIEQEFISKFVGPKDYRDALLEGLRKALRDLEASLAAEVMGRLPEKEPRSYSREDAYHHFMDVGHNAARASVKALFERKGIDVIS